MDYSSFKARAKKSISKAYSFSGVYFLMALLTLIMLAVSLVAFLVSSLFSFNEPIYFGSIIGGGLLLGLFSPIIMLLVSSIIREDLFNSKSLSLYEAYEMNKGNFWELFKGLVYLFLSEYVLKFVLIPLALIITFTIFKVSGYNLFPGESYSFVLLMILVFMMVSFVLFSLRMTFIPFYLEEKREYDKESFKKAFATSKKQLFNIIIGFIPAILTNIIATLIIITVSFLVGFAGSPFVTENTFEIIDSYTADFDYERSDLKLSVDSNTTEVEIKKDEPKYSNLNNYPYNEVIITVFVYMFTVALVAALATSTTATGNVYYLYMTYLGTKKTDEKQG